MKKAIFIILLIITSYYSYPQIETITWQKCMGTDNGFNFVNAVEKTSNGYLFGIDLHENGPGVSNYHGSTEAWIVNTDSTGNIFWERCYGGSEGDGPHKIIQINEQFYYLLNSSWSMDGDVQNGHGGNFWVVKIDDDGEIVWECSYGGSVHGEEVRDAILLPDNGLLMMGLISSTGGDVTTHYGDMDVWICRIDSTGSILWEKTFGNQGKDNGIKIKITSRNTVLMVGCHERSGGMIDCPDPGNYGANVWIVEMDLSGNILNQWCYGGTYWDQGFDIIEVKGGYIFAAYTNSDDGDIEGFHGIGSQNGPSDIWVVKIDSNGSILQQTCLGGTDYEVPNYLTQTQDDGVIIIGDAESLDGDVTGNHSLYGNPDIWVVKLDSTGILEWEHCFGGERMERFWLINSVLKKSDYNFVIGGIANYLDGDVGCDLFPNDLQDMAWLFEIKDCNYYAPQTPTSISGHDTLCSIADPFSSYSTLPAQWAVGYEWKFEPENAGTINYSDTTAQITWNPQFEGTVNIFARSSNDCGYSAWSEPFVTQVYTCMEIGEQGGGEAGRQGSVVAWPNPVSGVLSVKCLGLSEVGNLELIVYDIFGRPSTLPRLGEGQGGGNEGRGGGLDVSALPPGIYFISVLQDGKRVAGGKFIVAR
jgi:hypothetical protein